MALVKRVERPLLLRRRIGFTGIHSDSNKPSAFAHVSFAGLAGKTDKKHAALPKAPAPPSFVRHASPPPVMSAFASSTGIPTPATTPRTNTSTVAPESTADLLSELNSSFHAHVMSLPVNGGDWESCALQHQAYCDGVVADDANDASGSGAATVNNGTTSATTSASPATGAASNNTTVSLAIPAAASTPSPAAGVTSRPALFASTPFPSAPKPSPSTSTATTVSASIDSLPDAALQHCFSFIGNNHYRFIAGVNRRFQEIYSIKHEKKTTWENAALSLACAQLSVQDHSPPGRTRFEALEKVSIAAAKVGNVKVLEWTFLNGCTIDPKHLLYAAELGHVCVFEWGARTLRDYWDYSDLRAPFLSAIENEKINVMDWIWEHGSMIRVVRDALETALGGGCLESLRWMMKRDLIKDSDIDGWRYVDEWSWSRAAEGGHVNVLDFLHENGFIPPETFSRESHRNPNWWYRWWNWYA